MIISHLHRFVFIKVRKTASTSLEIALSSHCGEADVLTPISPEDEATRTLHAANYRLPIVKYRPTDYLNLLKGVRKEFQNHESLEEISFYYPEEVRNYFTFCFERNPFDKMVSRYYWRNQEKDVDVNEYIISEAPHASDKQLYTRNGEIAVDKVYKYEDMDNELADITSKLSLDGPLSLQGIHAKSNYRDGKSSYQDVLSGEARRAVEEAFAWEMKTFGYTW